MTEHLLRECRLGDCSLDLRLQQKSWQTYLQWRNDYCQCDWRDLVAASVREATHHFQHELNPLSREARIAQRRNALRDLMRQFPGDAKKQEERYRKQMNKSRADFYRRKQEVESGEFDEYDAA